MRGSLSTVIGATEDAVNFLNSTLSSIEASILSEANAAENAVVAAVNKVVDGVGGLLGLNTSIPKIELPSVSRLSTITIPDNVDRALQSLNNSLPTFDEVRNATDTAISFPFELLKVHTSIRNLQK